MAKSRKNRVFLVTEIVLTVCICSLIGSNLASAIKNNARQFTGDIKADYQTLIDGYITAFNLIKVPVTEAIEKDLSLEEMNAFLCSMDETFRQAVGADEYDSFALTYKGGYAHSWNYGDYSDYDPSTRPWYQQAQAAEGEIAVVAPYITFLNPSLLDDDQYVIMSIAQKYNNEISFDYDLKIHEIRNMLTKRQMQYDGAEAILIDPDGYILSASDGTLYCHNIEKPDDAVSAALCGAIRAAMSHPEKLRLSVVDGIPRFVYITENASGDFLCLLIPVASIFWGNISTAFLLAILLIMLELTLYYANEKRMRKQLRRVEEANQSKADFFARMSHDMRTPMNGILGISHLAQSEQDLEKLHQDMVKIQESGEYMLMLINDTLDLQRAETGRIELHPQTVDGERFIENIVDMVRATAEKKGVTFVVNYRSSDDFRFVQLDPLRVKQIFVNLLSNAVKFTKPGGQVELTIDYTAIDENTAKYRVDVKDSGVGMSQDFIKNRLFQPFSQEANEFSAEYSGSGLGLVIVKRMVELLGGTIEVSSMLGKGTVFTIFLDLKRVPAGEAVPAEKKKELPGRELLSGKRILLCEDHPLNAEISRRLLEKAGCFVTWAQNGRLGVEQFRQSSVGFFAAVLMDIRMPEMNGIEAAEAIRALPRADAADVPIIAMTANAYEEDVEKTKQAGMNEHLSKPVDPAKLYKTLVHFLGEKPESDA